MGIMTREGDSPVWWNTRIDIREYEEILRTDIVLMQKERPK